MNVAFLFNSDHPTLGSYYGPPVMERILSALQMNYSGRHMRVSVGDVLTYGAASGSKTPTVDFLIRLCFAVYETSYYDRLFQERLQATHGEATVYCWVFQNMTEELADSMHTELAPDPAYLGAMGVDFSQPLHLNFFRNSLIELYRLRENFFSIFYHMGQNEDPDPHLKAELEERGFVVEYEDIGARRTIFDDYDSIEHFKRVNDFKDTFSQFSGFDADLASDIALSLEELHPKLFDAFAAAARTIERAETEEDYAQAALSGRRLLEKVADFLFPPSDELWKGRKVGKNQYKNRLWAYLEKAIADRSDTAPDQLLNRLGLEADRLVDLFNAGLHASANRENVESAFSALGRWLIDVIALSPEKVRRPYLAYDEKIRSFMLDAFEDSK